MKILFVSSCAQLTGTGGGVTHTRGLLAMLEMISTAEVHQLVLSLPFASLPRKVRQARGLALGLVSRWPGKVNYLLDRTNLSRFRTALDSAAFDVVMLNGADLLPLADQISGRTACVLIAHNVESDIIRGQVEALRAPAPVRRLLQRDVEKTRKMEVCGARRMSAIIAISGDDADWYRRAAPEVEVTSLPGVFAYGPYAGPRPPIGRPLQVAYLAKMSWWPNREGAEWLLRSVLPLCSEEDVRIHFFGPGSEQYGANDARTKAHGFVERLESIWSLAHITICPMVTGSGINIKLIESIYNGVPVLATPHACRGLPAIADPALAVVPPEQWPAFLCSEHALALAARTVRAETVEMFSALKQAGRLASILGRASSRTRDVD